MDIYDQMIHEMHDRNVLSGYELLSEAPSMLAQQGVSGPSGPKPGAMQAQAGQAQSQGSQIKTQPIQQNSGRTDFNDMGEYRGAKLYNVTYNGFLAGYVTFYNGTYTFIYNPREYGNFDQQKPLYQSNFQQFKTLNSRQYQDVNKLKNDLQTVGQSAVVKTAARSSRPVV